MEQIDLPLSDDEKRIHRLVELFRKIWGKAEWIAGLRFYGAPHEGDYRNDAELILHELSHQSLLSQSFLFCMGDMKDAWDDVTHYINQRPLWEQDLHEIYAICVELQVARRLRLRLWRSSVLNAGRRNLQLLKYIEDQDYHRLIRRASKVWRVQHGADSILELVKQARERFK